MALTRQGARLFLLQACCCVAETSADVTVNGAVCAVAAALRDRVRFSVLGGRETLPRSLGSIYAMLVLLFLGSRFKGSVAHTFVLPPNLANDICAALSRDGARLFVTASGGVTASPLHVLRMRDGRRLQQLGSYGARPLQFRYPRRIWVAADGFVFVVDHTNNRIQVLTPQLAFHDFIGSKHLTEPVCVCADDAVVVVGEFRDRISVFERTRGTLVRSFRCDGGACGVCLMPNRRHIAAVQVTKHRVAVFSLEGELRRVVGQGKLSWIRDVACSTHGELVVADDSDVVVFTPCGDLYRRIPLHQRCSSVCVLQDTLFTIVRRDGTNVCVGFI
jgi:sugar lactone lactonase YvrE